MVILQSFTILKVEKGGKKGKRRWIQNTEQKPNHI